MATQTQQLLSSQVFTNAAVTANGEYDLANVNINNTNKLPNCRIIIEYENLIPNVALPGSFFISAILEGQRADGKYYPIAYQFEPFRRMSDGSQRIILVGPQIQSGQGIDDIIYPADKVEARVSKEQGNTAANMRLHLKLIETGFGMIDSFQSVKISAYMELFD